MTIPSKRQPAAHQCSESRRWHGNSSWEGAGAFQVLASHHSTELTSSCVQRLSSHPLVGSRTGKGMLAPPGCVAVPLTRTGLFAQTVLLPPFPSRPPGIQHILLGEGLSFSDRLRPQATKIKDCFVGLAELQRRAQRGTQSRQERYRRRHQPSWQVRTPGKFTFKPLSKSTKPKPQCSFRPHPSQP